MMNHRYQTASLQPRSTDTIVLYLFVHNNMMATEREWKSEASASKVQDSYKIAAFVELGQGIARYKYVLFLLIY